MRHQGHRQRGLVGQQVQSQWQGRDLPTSEGFHAVRKGADHADIAKPDRAVVQLASEQVRAQHDQHAPRTNAP